MIIVKTSKIQNMKEEKLFERLSVKTWKHILIVKKFFLIDNDSKMY